MDDKYVINLVSEGSEHEQDDSPAVKCGEINGEFPAIMHPAWQADTSKGIKGRVHANFSKMYIDQPNVSFPIVAVDALKKGEFVDDDDLAEGSSRDEPSGSDIDSGSEDSDNDGSSEDDQPLVHQSAASGRGLAGPPPGVNANTAEQKASTLKKVGPPSSSATTRKTAAPSSGPSTSTNSEDGTKTGTKRRIKRCGNCRSCLNPAWKQSCEETRKLRELEGKILSRAKSAAPKSSSAAGSAHVSKKAKTTGATAPIKSASAPAASGSNDEARDSFVRDLTLVMGQAGGVSQARHGDLLLSLLTRAKSWHQRFALAEVLVKSSPDVQQIIVIKKGLLVLQKWLVEAIDTKKVNAVKRILPALAVLPVTLQALQAPCELGKIVGNLRRAEGFEEVKVDAKNIVAKWRTLIQGVGDGGLSRTGSATIPNGTGAVAAASAGAAPMAAPKPTTAKPTTAKPTAPGSLPPGSANPIVDGEDIFGAADKKRAVVQPTAVPAAAAAAPRPTSAQQRPPSAAAAASKPPVKAKAPPPAARASVARVSASPLDALMSVSQLKPTSSFGVGSVSGGSGSTTSFGSGYLVDSLARTVPKSARERAMEAAARIPDPEPSEEPPRKKSKKVVWAGDSNLVAVRWFRKTDPPSKAEADADENDDSSTAAALEAAEEEEEEEEHQPQFASAAKQEHLSEAAVLRQHREQEDQERSEIEERMSEMVERVAWYDPPLIAAATNAALSIGKGQESGEAAAAAVRRLTEPPAMYPHGVIPPCPAEPVTQADLGVSQLAALIPRIPLTLVAVNTQQQQQQQQQQQLPLQQPLHQPVQSQGPHGPSAGLSVDISAALAQLTASGVLSGGGSAAAAAAAPIQGLHQHHQHHQQGYQHQHQQQYYQERAPLPAPPGLHQQHQHNVPPRTAYPPGMRVMVGLHRSGNQGHQTPTGGGGAPLQQGGPPPFAAAAHGGAGAPVSNAGGGGPRQGRSRTPCRFFQSKEGCFRGDKCNFSHVVVDPTAAAGGKRPLFDGAGPPSKAPRMH